MIVLYKHHVTQSFPLQCSNIISKESTNYLDAGGAVKAKMNDPYYGVRGLVETVTQNVDKYRKSREMMIHS